jgi:hypothetical protein
MIDMQLINNALTVIAIWSGAAILVAISIIAIAAGMRRRAATRHGLARAAHARAARQARTVSADREPALR